MSERTGLEVAVLAVAGRFPGAATVEEFWRRLCAGEDLIRRFSADELRAAGVDERDLANPEYVRAFGVLDDPDLFDAAFFDFTPRDAELVDPQHRLLLECAWEALERAGYDPSRLPGAPIGVFAGCNSNTYFIQQILPWLTSTEATYMSPGFGHDKDHLASLLAYKLGFEGPCATVQSACSTGLVAAHMACQALLNGECDVCLAGASSVIFPQHGYLGGAAGFVSPEGFCRSFDHRANGTVPGNGVGVIVLKRLEDALADRDPVLAVIKGSAINNDGAYRSGYTAPRLDGQAKVIRAAQLLAEVEPDGIQVVEAHGSATALGDPVEVGALTRAFRAGTERRGFCALGSVKSNVGHTGTAAGATGLIKTILALAHRQIPPSLHYERPNPEIDFPSSPFFVNTEHRDWPENAPGGTPLPRRAAVTSLGLGGANAHLILEEAPPRQPSGPSRPAQLLLLSAKTESALEAMTARLGEHLEETSEPLADVAFTLAVGRRRFRHRRALAAGDRAAAVEALGSGAFAQGEAAERPPAVAFLLPGIGDLAAGFGAELYASEPVFRAAFDACSRALETALDADLGRQLFSTPSAGTKPRLFERAAPSLPTRLAQPALFSFEIALARLWASWGVRPRAYLGYSLGELVAACLGGTFSLDDALAIVAARARLVEALPPGAMVAVPLSAAEVEPRLAADLSIAAYSAADQTVIAGPAAAVEDLERRLAADEIVSRRIASHHAFHTPMMAGAAEALRAEIERRELRPPEGRWLSNVTGTWIRPQDATDPDYWTRHLLSPVRLDAALGEILGGEQEHVDVLLEVGPGQALASLALLHPEAERRRRLIAPSFTPGRGESESLLAALGRLWTAGVEPDFDAFYADETRRRVLIPTYPFERRRYWIEPPAVAAPRATATVAESAPNTALYVDSERPAGAAVEEGAVERDAVEERVLELWREVLGIASIGRDDNFFELGGHSLAGLRITARLGKDLGLELPLRTLFEAPTVRQLARELRRLIPELAPTAAPVEGPTSEGPQPLSFAQERLWFLARLMPESPAYNIPSPMRLRGELDRAILHAALGRIVLRHQTLRTRFVEEGGGPVQRIDPALELELPLVDLQRLGDAGQLEAHRLADLEARLPFDLERGPLLRVTLLRLAPRDHVALFTVHHIVSDGWSTGVLIRELALLYRALSRGERVTSTAPLPPLPLQYTDYARRQRAAFDDGRMAGQVDHWRQRLEGLPRLDLPTDRPRSAQQSAAGGSVAFRIDAETTAALERLGREHGTTLFMTLLALVEAWLGRLGGEDDFAVGTPIAGRREPEVEALIGFFVNTLVLRADLSGAPSLERLLARTRDRVLEAFAHQDLPFEKLVEEIQPQRDLTRTPFFDVMFVLQNVPFEALELPELTLEGFGFDTATAKFDLTLSLWQTDDGLAGRAEFDRELFEATTVERLLQPLQNLVRAALEAPSAALETLPCLSAPARQQVLVEWNDSAVTGDEEILPRRIEVQAARTPEALAVSGESGALSYRELDAGASQLARHLLGLGLQLEDRVAVAVGRSPELLLGILAVLKAGGAYVPIDLAHPPARRRALLHDSGAALTLVGALPSATDGGRRTVPLDERRDWTHHRREPLPTAPGAANLAYVFYTSGSTGKPKGVMISHAAIGNRLRAEAPLSSDDRKLQHGAVGFDISVRELLWPLLHGATVVISRAAEEGLVPLRTMLEERITVASFVPSLLEVVLAEPEIASCRALVKILAGGEALPPALARTFYARFAERAVLENHYGPTEAAICVTDHACKRREVENRASGAESQSLPIGRAGINVRLAIVDRHLQPVLVGVAGELMIGGVQLARGYLGLAARTATSFVPDSLFAEPGERLYHSGDLTRWRRDGTVEFLGRLDHQLKIRGIRVEPGEIEAVLLAHPRVRLAAVVAVPDAAADGGQGEKRHLLVAWVVGDGDGPSETELRAFARERLPAALVPWRFLLREALPRLASGKIDRRTLADSTATKDTAQPDGESAAGGAEPRGRRVERPSLELLAEIWLDLLGGESAGGFERGGFEHDIFDRDFFELGGHSLLATRLISRIRQTFAVELPLRAVFEAPTLDGLSARIEQALAGGSAALPPITRRPPDAGPLPLSFAQQRLWLLDRLVPENPFYNMATAARVRGRLEAAAFARATAALLARHESLRTTFYEEGGEPRQRIAGADAVPGVRLIALDALDEAARSAQLGRWLAAEERRPFDLERGPLIRVFLFRTAEDDHTLLITMHHIVSDGWSMGVLYRELITLYEAACRGEERHALPELPIQYGDFSLWQRRWLGEEALDLQLGYWRQQLAGVPRVLELPTDRPRPPVPSFEGGGLTLRYGADLRRRLEALARRSQTTLAMTVLAAYKTLLLRLSGQTDFAVGVGIANRQRLELENLIGFFVNTLVLRSGLERLPRRSFAELLTRVRQVSLAAYAHQDLPFERLVEELEPGRDLSRNPLIQVMYGFQNFPQQPVVVRGLSFDLPAETADRGTSKFDLTLFLHEDGESGLHGQLEYNGDLFDATTIERWAAHLESLFESLLADPDRALADLDGLPAAQRQQLVVEADRGAGRWPRHQGLPQLFGARARRTPDALAVIGGDAGWSYAFLERTAHRLAGRLRRLGVGRESRVGLACERSFELIAGMLGIVDADAAYVPLDRAYPAERLEFMIRDARLEALVTGRATTPPSGPDPLVEAGLPAIDLGERGAEEDDGPRVPPCADGDSLAYLMYTSGSTGRPKGVAVVHRAVSRLVLGAEYVRLGAGDRLTHLASPSFDATTFEVWGALLTGAAVVVIDRDTALDLPRLERALGEERVDVAFVTTALFNRIVYQRPAVFAPLRQLLFGGEATDTRAVWKLLGETVSSNKTVSSSKTVFSGRLLNVYGPTESTTFATYHPVERTEAGAARLPIGRAIPHTRAHVLDAALHPSWLGASGELCLGGDGLARGYLGRPATTAEVFVPDPAAAAGERLYRTGDLVRRRGDGAIEFLRRIDSQIKLRGYRLELGEIETVLAEHPGVRASAVRLVERGEDRQLAGYVVPDPFWRGEDDAAGDSVRDWATLFDDLYRGEEGKAAADPTFDITGWNSTYTGEPLPAEEMRQWLDDTIARLRPALGGEERVLEIGCGTGMLLFRLAPHSRAYLASDVSRQALADLEPQTAALPQVRLLERRADQLDDLDGESLDLVILNSVVQYFPDLGYLAAVLDRAAEISAPGGAIFVGDVRSLPLLDTFHAALELFAAAPEQPVETWRQAFTERRAKENELAIDPAFFVAWARQHPPWRAEIFAKRGEATNELTAYRYQVMLRRGAAEPPPAVRFERWPARGVEALVDKLRRERPERAVFTHIPNARVAADVAALEALRDAAPSARIEDIRRRADRAAGRAIDPQQLLHRLGGLPYRVELSWARGASDGSFDLVLERDDLPAAPGLLQLPELQPDLDGEIEDWDAAGLANDPLQGRFARRLVPELRRFLGERLPEFMVPALFVRLDRLPLTANGKLDRAALPEPASLRPELDAAFVAPRTALEEELAAIWGEVLQLERIGVRDEFFALGGHSLLATQVVSRIRQRLGVELPLRGLFEAPTIQALAIALDRTPKTAAASAEPPLVPQPRPAEPPLSFAQERLWFLDRLEPGTGRYHEAAAVGLDGMLEPAAFGAALERIVERHETLRTTFPSQDGRPLQRIAPAANAPRHLLVVDLEALRPADRDAASRRLAGRRDLRRFDLAAGPLFRVLIARWSAGEQIVLFGFHHIVFDGWSIGVFLRELAAGYRAALAGRRAELPALPVQYADFALWQRRWLSGEVLDEQLEWWRRRLDGVPPLELPTDRRRGPIAEAQGASVPWRLEPEVSARLQRLAQERGATLYMALLAVLEVLLWRYSGQRDFAVGAPIANRNRVAVEGLIGFFVNMLVFRADLSGPRRRQTPSFATVLERVRDLSVDAYGRQDVPFERLVETLQPERRLDRSPLFQVAFQLLDLPATELRLPGLVSRPYPLGHRASKFDLSLNLSQGPSGVGGLVDYRADLFDATTLQRLLNHLGQLAASAIEDPERPIAQLDLLHHAERQQIVREWNDTVLTSTEDARTEHASPAEESVVRRFSTVASERGDAVALIEGEAAVTYGETAHRAGLLARQLRGLGVGPDDVIGVFLPRSQAAVIGVLAALQSGGAYLPLPPDLPPERLAFLLADARPRAILSLAGDAALLPPTAARVVEIAAGGRSPSPLPQREDGAAAVHPLQAAYVLYTSGSTGRPKAVVVPHRALANHMRWYRDAFPLGDDGALLHKTPATFDVAVGELLSPLLDGARLVLAPAGAHRDPARLIEAVERHRVTALHLVPTQLRMLLTEPSCGRRCASLRRLFCGGEPLGAELATRARERLPTDLFNVYGPAETAIRVSYQRVGTDEVACGTGVAIGRPIPKLRLTVLDERLEPVPPGVGGELAIGGVGSGRGYLRRPARTAASFVPDPFAEEGGARLYLTGDLCRQRADGRIEFAGRRDHQVKLRGFRLELGEVESALRAHPAVEHAVALLTGDAADQRLIAALVPSAEDRPGERDLQSFLRRALPEAAVPSAFVWLDALPTLDSGKLDRRTLVRQLRHATATGERPHQAPRDEVERELVRLWEETLKLTGLGVDDDFFALGGHSLLAVHLVERIAQRLGQSVPLALLFEAATPEHLARHLRRDTAASEAEHGSPLIALRPPRSGASEPLFLVHPLGGDVVGYRDLALALSDDQPVYAFRAAGLEADERPDDRVEAMARRYVAALLELETDGPLRLGGWSFGATVAFEMARQLSERGRALAPLLVVDGRAERGEEALVEDDARFWVSFAEHLGLSATAIRDAVARHRAAGSGDDDSRLVAVLNATRDAGLLPAEAGIDALRRRLEVFRAQLRAAAAYEPGPLEVEVALFQAADRLAGGGEDLAAGWRRLALGGVISDVAPGTHHTLVRGASARSLAGRIRSLYAARTPEATAVGAVAGEDEEP